jgi:hypothetical protein
MASTEHIARLEYVDRLSRLSRAELLKLCRAGGFSAHRLTSNEAIADLLWRKFGRERYGYAS